jgi:hypothetical protein
MRLFLWVQIFFIPIAVHADVTIWVNDSHPNAGINSPACDFTPGQPGESFAHPLKGAGGNGVMDALACVRTNPNLISIPVTIIVACTTPVNGFCDYDNDQPDAYQMGDKGQGQPRIFTGWPEG